jgi:creatinine amidohydrolase/Fe(II)-dependent formamide hydrolase-like protein
MKALYMSWSRVESILSSKRGRSVVALLPVGSFEQHSLHLPLTTDFLIAQRVAEMVEEAVPSRVVLYPGVVYGCSQEHGTFPGTVSVGYEHFLWYLEDAVKTMIDGGYRNVAIVNGHGGNIAILTVLQRKVNFDLPRKGTLHVFNTVDNSLAKKLFEGRQIYHAGFVETSLLEGFAPGAVDYGALSKTSRKDFRAAKNKGIFSTVTVKEASSTGMVEDSEPFAEGDPTKGKEMLEVTAERIVAAIRKLSR